MADEYDVGWLDADSPGADAWSSPLAVFGSVIFRTEQIYSHPSAHLSSDSLIFFSISFASLSLGFNMRAFS